MIFIDDIVTVANAKVAVNVKLEQRRDTLEICGLRISQSKKKHLWCNFSNEPNDEGMDAQFGEQLLFPKDNFRHLVLLYKKING